MGPIGVNALALRVEHGGARRAFLALMRHLALREDGRRYLIFAPASAAEEIQHADGQRHRLEHIHSSTAGELLAHRGDFGLYFAPLGYFDPPLTDRPSVAVLYDLQEHQHPERFSRAELLWRLEHHPSMCRRASVVVTASEFTRRHLVEKFSLAAEKIRVIPLGGQMGLCDADAVPQLPEPMAGNQPFVLYPANWHVHKDHRTLLDALCQLRDAGRPLEAVFCGRAVGGGVPLRRMLAERGLAGQCRVLGHVPVEELRRLYRQAAAVVLPSLYEGFGLPAVEAMACGSALICSDIPAFREVAGEAARYFAAGDSAGLAEAMGRCLDEPEAAEAARGVGRRRAARYEWERIAAAYAQVFDDAAAAFAERGRPAVALGRAPRAGEGWDSWLGGDGQAGGRLAPLSDARLVPEAGVALAAALAERPDALLYVGEAIEEGRRPGLCRLRRTADDLWRLDGGLWPAMLFVNAEVARRMLKEGVALPMPLDSPAGRWRLLRLARRMRRLALVEQLVSSAVAGRRTLVGRASAWMRGQRLYYRVADDRPAPAASLRAFEGVLKRCAALMPLGVQHLATRLWYRMTSG